MMDKKSIIIIVILLLIIVGGIYKFMFQGATRSASDGRTAIILDVAERDLVFEEMRTFLVSIQRVIDGINKDDMTQVSKAAKKVGTAVQQAIPGTLMGKLPIDFKKLGFDTHQKFDQLALDAETLGDKDQTLEQLSKLMQNCIACHNSYRLDVKTK